MLHRRASLLAVVFGAHLLLLTDKAMRPTALTASLAMSGLMSRAYSVSSPTISYTLVELASSVRISIFSCLTYLRHRASSQARGRQGGVTGRTVLKYLSGPHKPHWLLTAAQG